MSDLLAGQNIRLRFNVEQAADYAGCHPVTVRKALAAGELKGGQRRVHGRWSIRREDLDAWLDGEKRAAS